MADNSPSISTFDPSAITPPDTGMPSMEELQAPTNLPPSGADYAQSIASGQSITDLINEVQALQANNEAAVGGGITGISAYSPNREYDINKAFDSFSTQLSTPTLQSFNKPMALGKESDYNRYKDSKYFQTFGYTPNLGEEQEYKYGRAMTWGDTIGNALAGGTGLAYNTFVEGWKGWGRMTSALFNWDSSKLMGSEEERYEMAKEQEELMNKYAIYDTETSKDGIFNRQFFGNMLQQSGFAVGAIAQFALEEFATAGVGGFISGGLKLTGKVAKTAAAAKKTADVAENAFTLGKAAERVATPFKPATIGTISELNNATRKVMNTVTGKPKVLDSIVNSLKALTPGYGTIDEMIKMNKAGAGLAQLAYTGLGGVKRGLSEFNMARSESIFEAATTYKTLQDRLVEEYTTKNGAPPTGQDLENIKQKAEDASHDAFYTNVGVLSVMNRIQFDNMYKSFSKSRSLLGEGASDLANRAFQVTAKTGAKIPAKVYEKGLLGGVSAIGQVAKDFGKRKAAWEATKSIGKGLMKFEGSEGAQELIQEATSKGLEQYYYDLYHGKKGYSDRMDAVLSNIENPITSTEGMKTFLMGALTGRLIAPLTLGARGIATKIDDARKLKADPNYKTAKQKTTEAVQMMNALYTDPQWFTKEAIANIKVNNKAAETMEEAVANRNKYVFNNSKDSALAKTVAAAIKLDMYDSLRDVISEYGAGMSNEEFKQAFGIDPTETNKKDVKALSEDMVKNVEDYYQTFKTLKDKYANLIIPELYKNNDPEVYQNALLQKRALDDTIELIASNSFKAKQVIKRASDLQNQIAANKNIGSSSMQILTNLSNDDAIIAHVDILTDDVKRLESAEGPLTKEAKDLLDSKKEELEYVRKWKEAYFDILDNTEESYSPGVENRAYRAYADLINFYNKRNKITAAVSKEDVEDNFLKFTDYIKLNNDGQEYVDAMNLLADPKNMGLVANALASGRAAAVKKFLEEQIAELEKETGESTKEVPTHTITKEEDGTFTITSPDGTEVATGIATEEEANNMKAELDQKLAEELAKEEEEQEEEVDDRTTQEKLKDLKVGDTITVNGKKAKVRNIEMNVGETIGSIDIEYPYEGTLDYTTAEEIASRQDTLYIDKDGKISSGKTGEAVVIDEITPKITVDQFLKSIADSKTFEELDDIQELIDASAEELDFTEEEFTKIDEAIEKRKKELEELASKKGKRVFIKDTDPEFVNEYVAIQKQIADIVNKPDVTVEEATNAFKLFIPLFSKLEVATRQIYNAKHLAQRNAIVAELVKEQKSKDIAGAKQAISKMLSSDDFSFDTTVEDVFNILDIVLKPELKEEAIQHFEQEYLKAIDKRIAKLRANANTGEVSPLIEKLSSIAETFETKVRKSIETLEAKAQEIADKRGDTSYVVNISSDFENKTHRGILEQFNGDTTPGQRAAIRSFQKTGMIVQEDLDTYDINTKHGASEVINLAIGRMYTISLNSAAKLHFEKNDSTQLKKVLFDYLSESAPTFLEIKDGAKPYTKEEIEEDIELWIDKTIFSNIDELFEKLDITKLEDIISDEEYKLINDYKRSVFRIMDDGNVISILDSFNERQGQLLSSSSSNDATNIITLDMAKSLEKYIKYEAGAKKEDLINRFYSDLISSFETLKGVKDTAEGLKIINDLITKHIDPKNTDGRTIVQSLIGYALKTNNLLTSEEEDPQPLTEEQMKSAINTPTDSLTVQQIAQVEEFAKTTNLENIKKKLNAAAGYSIVREGIVVEVPAMEITRLKFNSLRQKNATDLRSSRDIYLKLKATDNQAFVKDALQFILDSDYATKFEKALAEKIMAVANESDVITIDNTINALGEFDSDTNKISINLDATSYDEKNPNAPKAPVETVILHELMHALTQKAISDPASEYGKAIRSVFNAVKNQEGAKTFYAFQDSLTPDEQLHEFVAEAFTNPAFQYMLAKTPYANTTLTVWDKLMEIVGNILRAIGIDINNTALSEVLSLTDGLLKKGPIAPIGPGPTTRSPKVGDKLTSESGLKYTIRGFSDKTGGVQYTSSTGGNGNWSRDTFDKYIKEGRLKYDDEVAPDSDTTIDFSDPEPIMEQIKNAATVEELAELSKNLEARKSEFNEGIYNGLQASVNRKIQSIEAQNVKNELKGYESIKINGKTYYYSIKNGKVNVVRKSGYKLANVRKGDILRTIADKILAKNKIQDILPASIIDIIKSLGGNPESYGTYANGSMIDDGSTIGEQRYPNAYGLNVRLSFDRDEFRRFLGHWRKYQKKEIRLDELSSIYGYNKTAVGEFGEIMHAVGSIADVRKLINKGYIDIRKGGGSGTLSDLVSYDTKLTSDELFAMFNDVINNVNLDISEYDDINGYIKKQLSNFFGFTVSDDMQKQLEGQIFYSDVDADNPPDDFTIDAPFTVVSDLASAQLENGQLDITKINPDSNISAVNSNGLRSASFVDGRVVDGEYVPHPDFVKYYHKVRSIINKLSVANPVKLDKLHVTLDVDSADLRWDGSSENPEWQKAVAEKKGVIGYISDDKGNPIIFDKEGNQVGVLDRNNLADKKGLDNGDNQIVYFTTMNPNTKKDTLSKIDKTSLDVLFKAREAVLAGRPQIAKLQKVDKGQMDLKQAAERGVKFQRNTLKDLAMNQGLKKDNVTLGIDRDKSSGKKPGLRAFIKDSTGAVSKHPLFTPNARNVKIVSAEGEFTLFDHIFELMKLYNQMVNKQGVDRIGDLQQNILMFARNIFYTSDNTFRFVKNFKAVELSVKDSNGVSKLVYLPLIDFVGGEMKINEDNLKKIRNYANNQKVNVYEKWLTEEDTFSIPYITEENEEKVIKFEDRNFRDFLIDNVGLISYISDIPDAEDIMRYNSTVHFLKPSDLNKPEPKPVPNEQQIVQDPNVIKDNTKDSIKNTTASTKKFKDPSSTKIFKSPSYEEIFEKKCK